MKNVLYFHNLLYKLFIFNQRTVFDSRLIRVDRMHGIIQEFGNPLTIVDAQTDQSKDAHLGGKGMVVGRKFAVFFLKEQIKPLNEVGKNLE